MNATTVLATVLAMVRPLGPAAADVVTDWNTIAVTATAIPPNSILRSRALAMTHAATFDAINAIERRHAPYAVDVTPRPGASVDAAGAAAAPGVLVRLAPGQSAMLDGALKDALARVPGEQARTDGAAIGRPVAERIVAMRASDGADGKGTFTPTPGPGRWSRRRRCSSRRSSRNGAPSPRSSCPPSRSCPSSLRPA
jgi:hypothetical protein